MKERFKQVRETNKLSQAQYAKILGVSLPVIKHVEQGNTKITLELAKKVRDKFGVTTDWLAGVDEAKQAITIQLLQENFNISNDEAIVLLRTINVPKKRKALIDLLTD